MGGEPLVTDIYCHTSLSKEVCQSIFQVRHRVIDSGQASPKRIVVSPEGTRGSLSPKRLTTPSDLFTSTFFAYFLCFSGSKIRTTDHYYITTHTRKSDFS